MNPKLIRTVLTWLAPIAIAYVVKKFEERSAKKAQEKTTAQN